MVSGRRKVSVEFPALQGEMSVAQALKLAASIAALGAALGVNAPSALASQTPARARQYPAAPKDAGAPDAGAAGGRGPAAPRRTGTGGRKPHR